MSALNKVDIGGILSEYDIKFNSAADSLAHRIAEDCDRYVPYRSGRLARSVICSVSSGGKASVRYTAPYAREVYYNNRGAIFSKEIHAQSCAMWFEAARAVNTPAWVDQAKRIVLR